MLVSRGSMVYCGDRSMLEGISCDGTSAASPAPQMAIHHADYAMLTAGEPDAAASGEPSPNRDVSSDSSAMHTK
jgi:hypothetical protein